jgi:hypothetical protein
MAARVLPIDLTFAGLDPHKHDRVETVIALTAGGAPCPLGSAPVWPRILLTGAASPVLTLRSGAGAVLGTVALPGVAGDVTIDCDTATITGPGGVSRIAALPNAALFPFALDPADAVAPGGLAPSWPTLGVTGAAGEVRYRRAWR